MIDTDAAPDEKSRPPAPRTGRVLTLIGADGAGKSTHARDMCERIGERAVYIYLGSNPAAITHALPSSHVWHWLRRSLGGSRHQSGPPAPGPTVRPVERSVRLLRHLKSLAVLIPRVSDELYRLFLVELYARRGHVVIVDRHPYPDYHASRVRGAKGWLRWGDRIHGLLLEHVYPRPRGVTLLDAPPEVLHARKPEGSLSAVRARRQEYLDLAGSFSDLDVTVLDVERPQEEVLTDLLRLALDRTPFIDTNPTRPGSAS